MSSFKVKNKKKNINDVRVTLDAKHTEKVKYFNELKNTVPEKKKLLEKYENEYKILQQNTDFSEKKFTEMNDVYDKILKIKDEINNIKDDKEETEYLLNTGKLLFQYYENIDAISEGNSIVSKESKKPVKKIKSSSKSVIDFFHNTSNDSIEIENLNNDSPENIDDDSDNELENLSDNELENYDDYEKPSKFINKEKLLNKYINITESKNILYISDDEHDEKFDICTKCNIEKILIQSTGLLICKKCGYQEKILVDSDKPSYKDPPREISYFAYKRINHFNEWLAQFQAKESTDIPNDVYDKIILEIKKERIVNMALLSPLKLRSILKKLKLNKYYEHVPHIINRINGIPPPIMTRETEEKLRMMFREIQTPFVKHCPKDRKNFLSYSYVLHKFCELLELDDFLKCFPYLKSTEKLRQQDAIWKDICKELKLQYIPSI